MCGQHAEACPSTLVSQSRRLSWQVIACMRPANAKAPATDYQTIVCTCKLLCCRKVRIRLLSPGWPLGNGREVYLLLDRRMCERTAESAEVLFFALRAHVKSIYCAAYPDMSYAWSSECEQKAEVAL
jgi:hypothetical protein